MVRMDSQSSAIISGVENHHRGLGNSSSWLHFQWPAPLNTHCRSVPHSFPDEGLLQESHLQVFRSPSCPRAGQHGPSLPDSCRGDKALQLLNRGPDNSHFTAFYNLIAFILVILSTRLSHTHASILPEPLFPLPPSPHELLHPLFSLLLDCLLFPIDHSWSSAPGAIPLTLLLLATEIQVFSGWSTITSTVWLFLATSGYSMTQLASFSFHGYLAVSTRSKPLQNICLLCFGAFSSQTISPPSLTSSLSMGCIPSEESWIPFSRLFLKIKVWKHNILFLITSFKFLAVLPNLPFQLPICLFP